MAEQVTFAEPPVEEMAIGAVFTQPEKLKATHLSSFWREVSDDYPLLEAYGAPPAPVDDLKQSFFSPSPLSVIVGHVGDDNRRFWFTADPPSVLIQLQRDMFTRNWRRIQSEQVYPEYPLLKDAFLREWHKFLRFTDLANVGRLAVQQYEVTYVNVIPRGTGWNNFGDLADVTTAWSGAFPGKGLPVPLSVNFQVVLPIDDIGRLVVTLSPTRRKRDSVESLCLTISARIGPTDDDPTQAEKWIDMAHIWCRKGFEQLTASKVRNAWGAMK